MANAKALSLGPGVLYVAPLLSPIPTDLATAWDAAWARVGYTEEGSEFSYEFSTDPVEVAESLDPLFYRTTGRTGTVSFSMAENTARNLTWAFNGGTVVTSGVAPNQVVTYEPPEPGQEVRRMVGFQSEDGQERWIFRQCFQGGTVSMVRRKGSDKTLIPVEMRVEKPASGKPFTAIYHIDRA